MVLLEPDDVGMVHALMQLHLTLYFFLGELVLLRVLVDDLAGELAAVGSINELIALPESSLRKNNRTLPSTLPML